MGDENFIIEKVTTVPDPKKTGAIPRNVSSYSTQYLPVFYWDAIEKINQGYRVCIILRGLPGSGKSFLGRKIIEDTIRQNCSEHIISADDFFIKNGKYQYDLSKLSEAHQYAQRLFAKRANLSYSPLIVDNTNMQSWEMYPYFQLAIQYNYYVELMEPNTPWKWAPLKLSQKNKHSVNMEKIKKMMDKYDKVINTKNFAKSYLNLDLVKEPLMRSIPPYKPKITTLVPANTESNSINFDGNNNYTNNEEEREPLSWQKFNSGLNKKDTPSSNSILSYGVSKKNQIETESSCWNLPPQIFEENWDQANEKEITVKEKNGEELKPQPQRKQQRKSKKPLSPPLDVEQQNKPHKKNCPNENQSFVQLRELYPNYNEQCLWDFFEKCKFDTAWCADMLFDENFTGLMDTGEDLTCHCLESNEARLAINSKNITATNNKKQTPIKAKKIKSNTDELLAAKIAIEENIKIGNEFYPEHVNKVKVWKGVSSQRPVLLNDENLGEIQEDENLVPLTVNEDLINELNGLFGDGSMVTKELLDQNRSIETKMFIKSSTAKKLYKEILETLYSHHEEAKFQEIENDRYFALMLHEQEKANKYPQLVQESTCNNFKDIMDTQAALKEYEKDIGEWTNDEKQETIAGKLNKEKLYKIFKNIDKDMIDQIFEAQDRNLKKTIEIIQDSLGYSDEQRRQVVGQMENLVKFDKESIEAPKEEFTNEEYACIKRVEELQEQFDHHSEEQMRCIQRSREHIAKKEFRTASYYTSMVNLHKQLCEEKRQELMNILAFSFLNNASSSRLDLHYFTQEGGKTRLHTFLDAHIAKLREIKKQFMELEIVTGRGNHSLRGPVLKNMTIKLFQERGLRFSESNPGLLKVKVYPNSILYEEYQRLNKVQN